MIDRDIIKNTVVGWIILIVVLSPLIVGWVLGGEDGARIGTQVWIGLFTLAIFTIIAFLVGSLIRGEYVE